MPIKAFRFAAATRAQTDTGLEGDLADHYRFFTAISELVGHGNSGIAIATGTLSRTVKMKFRIDIDKSTLAGTVVALAGIAAGLLIEGGRLTQVLQPTAALIVFGGTLGAVMVQFPLSVVLRAFLQLKNVFFGSEPEPDALIQNLLRYAYKARKEGLLSLDAELNKIQDPFLKESLMLAIDGTNVEDLRRMMELQLDYRAEKDERVPKVFESAAGFSPTIGILGAVLGLIQVMQHLQDINEVGKGIAVAFVATIYGVGAANLLFLPWAGKLKLRIRERQVVQEMTLEAVLSIMMGMNPRALELQLFSYLPTAGLKPGLAKVGTPKMVPAKAPVRQAKASVAKSR
jgi:chemotaxis protein MotA